MKKIICIMLLYALVGCHQKSEKGSTPDISKIPAFDLLLTDSTTVFNTGHIPTGSSVILMYFSPDCEHCQHQTEALVKNIQSLDDVRIYLLTPMPFGDMKAFYLKYRLSRYKNVTVGQDYQYAFYKYYKATAYPCTAFYDGNKRLIRLYRQEIGIDRIRETLHPQTALINQ